MKLIKDKLLKIQNLISDIELNFEIIEEINDLIDDINVLFDAKINANRLNKNIMENKNINKIIDFLLKNGYIEDSENDSEYRSFYKNNLSHIDINEEEIVLISDWGDWLHLPVNFYALLGTLIHHRELALDYSY